MPVNGPWWDEITGRDRLVAQNYGREISESNTEFSARRLAGRQAEPPGESLSELKELLRRKSNQPDSDVRAGENLPTAWKNYSLTDKFAKQIDCRIFG